MTKKYTLLYILAGALLCGCNQRGNSNHNDNQTAKKDKQYAENIITKTIPIPCEFTHLTSISGADIIYTQGDYGMEVTGDSAKIIGLETNFESNLLTISFKTERNSDINIYETKQNVTINISAPNLACVSICGCGNFTSKGKWKGEKIELGTIGKGNFECDSIECQIFDYRTSGEGEANFCNIKAESTHISNVARTTINANVDTKLLMCENSGTSAISFSGTALKQELFPTKEGKILFK